MENDIEKLHITHEDITERTPLRNKLHHFKCLQEKSRRKTGTVWTEGRKEKSRESKRNEAVETNLVYSGLLDIKSIIIMMIIIIKQL